MAVPYQSESLLPETGCAWVHAVTTLLRYAAVGKRGVRVATTNIKEEARKLIEGMPDDST
jgi:hypothetical protein